MNISVNQNRQFYYVSSVGTVTEASNAGVASVASIGPNHDKLVYITVKGADTVLRSDLIPVSNIVYAKKVAAADMAYHPKTITVAFDSNVSSTPIAGQTYILNLNLRQFYGMSDADQYFKQGVVYATSAMASTPLTFWQAMANSLALNFSREIGSYKDTNGNYVNAYLNFTASANGLVITEKEQPWKRGMYGQSRVVFEAYPSTITQNNAEVVWGTATDGVDSTTSIGNGHRIADLEFFCMGERGDQYRDVGARKTIPTEYLVDPTQAYDVLEIHYSFKDSGVNSYKSEKDITLVGSPSAITSLVTAFQTASGITVEGASSESGNG